jgi:hypothetical protein
MSPAQGQSVVTEGKIACFEALAPTLHCRRTESAFSENSAKFSVYRFIYLPLQEEEFHRASLLLMVHLIGLMSFLTF